MNDETRFKGEQTRSFEFEDGSIRVLDEESRTVELSFSSETPVARFGGFEILSHKKDAVNLERLQTAGCLLFNHNRDKVIGKIVEVAIKNKRGTAKVQFDDDTESLVYYNKVKNKTLRGVSIGYLIHDYDTKTKKEKDIVRTTYTITSWTPYEISIVSVPADITVGIGRSFEKAAVMPQHNLRMLENQFKINKNIKKLKEATEWKKH